MRTTDIIIYLTLAFLTGFFAGFCIGVNSFSPIEKYVEKENLPEIADILPIDNSNQQIPITEQQTKEQFNQKPEQKIDNITEEEISNIEIRIQSIEYSILQMNNKLKKINNLK